MYKVLLTGHSGFLGRKVLEDLLEFNDQIFCLLGPSGKKVKTRFDTNKIRYCDENLLQDRNFKENFGEIQIIIHAATKYDFNSSYEEINESNFLLPARLLDLSENLGVKFFVNLDTYLRNKNYKRLPEYTLSKSKFREHLTLKSAEKKVKGINLVIHHLYGPNDSPNKFTEFVLQKLHSNSEEIELTSGKQTRDFIYLDDASNAISKIVSNIELLKDDFFEIEIGSGIETSVEDFVKSAKNIIGSKSILKFGALPLRKNEIMRSKANVGILKSFGWRPSYSLEKGISSIKIYKDNQK